MQIYYSPEQPEESNHQFNQGISSSKSNQGEKSTLLEVVNRFWLILFKLMIASSEPRVVKRRDRSNQTYFQVYDPITQRSFKFIREKDVRIWLERRYYL